MVKKTLPILLVCLVFVSCDTTSNVDLTVFNRVFILDVTHITFSIDGVGKGTIPAAQSQVFEISEGKHSVRADFAGPSGSGFVSAEIELNTVLTVYQDRMDISAR